jgi:CRP/FNR family transcriptional regulator, cyclic AMP receptor protein
MKANPYHEYLRQVPLFESLTPDELDQVGEAATDLFLDAGNVLMREGTLAHEMLIITSGTVEVTRDGEHIADVGPGGFVGELALLTHRERHSTITTKTAIEAIHIDGRRFNTLLEDAPMIAVRMLPIVASKLAGDHDSHSR